MHKNTLVLLSVLAVFSAPISSAPLVPLSERDASRSGFVKQNGLDAQKQNAQFATMKSSDSCQTGSTACVQGGFAECLDGKWIIQPCDHNLYCFALPLVNSQGVSLTCDTVEDAAARISNAVNGTSTAPPDSDPPEPLSSSSIILLPSSSTVPLPSSNTIPSPSASTVPSDDSGDDDCECDSDDDCSDDNNQNDIPASPAGDDDECTDESEGGNEPAPMAISSAAASATSKQAVAASTFAASSASQQPPTPSSSSPSSGYQYRRQAYDLVPAVTESATVETSNASVSIVPPTSTPVAGGASTITVVSTSISTVTVGCDSVSTSAPVAFEAFSTPFVSKVVNDPGIGFVSFGFATV